MSEDLISRQAAIDAFLKELTKRERKNLLHTWSTVEVKYFITELLEKLPSVQERKGKWVVEYGSDFKTYKVSRCSECGFEYGTVANLFKFCPYCGASMTEGAEDAGRDE